MKASPSLSRLPQLRTLCGLRTCTIVLAAAVLNLFFVWLVLTMKGIPTSSLFKAQHSASNGTLASALQHNSSAPVNGTSCAQALGIPTVAMMFLTVGELFHEPSWRVWFEHAANIVPAASVYCNATAVNVTCDCSRDRLTHARNACMAQSQGPLLQRQHLFSIYIHSSPEYEFPEDSIFHGYEIEDRRKVDWGTHQLVDGTKALLRAALRNPLNHKFMLLSETHIPLYPAQLIYQQLMSEETSRLDSWGVQPTDLRRWTQHLRFDGFHHGFWRKSSQWFALRRDHAQLAVDDTVMNDKFEQHCTNGFDSQMNRWRDCFSDEHYIPSLIAYSQRGHETDGWGSLVHVQWAPGAVHPRAYGPEEIHAGLLKWMRGDGPPCDQYDQDIREVRRMFVSLKRIVPAVCRGPPPHYNQTIVPQCPLLSRKFPRETVEPLLEVFKDCSNGLAIANSGRCGGMLGRKGRQLLEQGFQQWPWTEDRSRQPVRVRAGSYFAGDEQVVIVWD